MIFLFQTKKRNNNVLHTYTISAVHTVSFYGKRLLDYNILWQQSTVHLRSIRLLLFWPFLHWQIKLRFSDSSLNSQSSDVTVVTTSVSKRPVLFTKPLKFTMRFYYVKVPSPSRPQSSTLALTGALKWGIVWAFISAGIETMHCQS